jgi:hypothetical protein
MATRRQGDPPKLSLSLPSSNRPARETLDSLTATVYWMTTALAFREASLLVAGTASVAQ